MIKLTLVDKYIIWLYYIIVIIVKSAKIQIIYNWAQKTKTLSWNRE